MTKITMAHRHEAYREPPCQEPAHGGRDVVMRQYCLQFTMKSTVRLSLGKAVAGINCTSPRQ